MNNQSPLVPQGSLLEQKNQGRARVKIAVFVVLAIHGIGLLALLMQGCKKEPDAGSQVAADTNTAPAQTLAEQTNTVPAFSNAIPTTSSLATTNVEPAPVTPVNTTPGAVPPPTTLTDYKVAKGDNYTTIARKFHTSTKALTDANPGVNPTALQIGQTLHIPPPTTGNGTGIAAAAGTDSTATDQVYSVQSGDTLIKIAEKFHVSVKALQTANNLTTTRIRVGQKLKVPAKATTAPATNTAVGGSTAPGQ